MVAETVDREHVEIPSLFDRKHMDRLRVRWIGHCGFSHRPPSQALQAFLLQAIAAVVAECGFLRTVSLVGTRMAKDLEDGVLDACWKRVRGTSSLVLSRGKHFHVLVVLVTVPGCKVLPCGHKDASGRQGKALVPALQRLCVIPVSGVLRQIPGDVAAVEVDRGIGQLTLRKRRLEVFDQAHGPTP